MFKFHFDTFVIFAYFDTNFDMQIMMKMLYFIFIFIDFFLQKL